MWTIYTYIAGTIATVAFLPQTLKVLKTKNTKGISLLMYSLCTIGVLLWTIYGFATKQYSIAITNSIISFLSIVVLIFKIDNTIKGRD